MYTQYLAISYVMCHDAKLVERWLAIEQHNITVYQVTLDYVSTLKMRTSTSQLSLIGYSCHDIYTPLIL